MIRIYAIRFLVGIIAAAVILSAVVAALQAR